MSLNLHHGKFDYCSTAPEVHAATWAVHHLSDVLWDELRGYTSVAAASVADWAARRCWDRRFIVHNSPLHYASSCECVELVLS